MRGGSGSPAGGPPGAAAGAPALASGARPRRTQRTPDCQRTVPSTLARAAKTASAGYGRVTVATMVNTAGGAEGAGAWTAGKLAGPA
jgi:hypothetical protein